MNKAYILAICMLGASFVGCIEEEDKPSDLENAFNSFLDSITNKNHRELCKYTEFTLDEENNTIILANNAELDECVEDVSGGGDDAQIKITVSDYSEENLDYKPANNSGSLYLVSATIKVCNREDNSEPWDCDSDLLDMDWVKVGGQWLWWDSDLEQGEAAPIATFFVEEDSNNVYHVEVIKVSKQEDLEEFSYFLKDGSGNTYGGGNGFGVIAMQIINGEEHGIDMTYEGDDQQLKSRADNISNDDGSNFPVHFSDNDRDGKLSSGDQFLVYGKEDGPAEDGWKLDIQYNPSGDIIGSAKLL
jgi:hypothetical protein